MAESFVEFLDRYGEANPPSMVYREGADFVAWQAEFLAGTRELMGPVPARVACRPEIVETVAEPDHERHLLTIPVNEFSALVAYLLVPSDLSGDEERPGLLAFHGHATYGMDSLCGVRGMGERDNAARAYALSAVRSGYVVLVPAWWGWHGRDAHLDRVGRRDKCNVIQTAAGMYGLNVIALHMQDAAAACDVLSARPEVDAGRIGCLGNSYGGRTAMWFTALDERVRACVASGCMNDFRERSLKLSSCGIQYPFGLLRYGDVAEVFSLIAPRALQLQCGEQDALITPQDRDRIERVVRGAYERTGAVDRYEYHLHPGGHILLWPPAEQFLQAAL